MAKIAVNACGNPECSVSSGIHEGLTFGSGHLDDYGYFENPCNQCARDHEKNYPNDGEAWPFEHIDESSSYYESGKDDLLNEIVKNLETLHANVQIDQNIDMTLRRVIPNVVSGASIVPHDWQKLSMNHLELSSDLLTNNEEIKWLKK